MCIGFKRHATRNKRAMKIVNKIVVGLGWAFAGVFGSVLVLIFVAIFLFSKRSVNIDSLQDLDKGNAVGVVELKGEIFSAEGLRSELDRLASQKNIKAIVLRIESPGGTLGASEEIYQLIKDTIAVKPVVCSLGSIAASGGLYVANACSKIVAHRGTITGSIGVIFMTPYLGNILERFGLKMNVIKSGKFKDAGSPFRELTEEDKEILQGVVDQGYQQFIEVISKSRELPIEEVKKFADGRILLGEKALELGLVDYLGDTKRAAKVALELAGVEGEPKLVYNRESAGFFALLRSLPNSKLVYHLDSLVHPRVLYKSIY